MNAVTSFVAIASLLLALGMAGGVANKQTGVRSPAASRNITPSKLGVNHNETLVSDAASVQHEDTLSEWLMNLRTSVFTRFSSYVSTRGPCENWGCGSNHNETLVNDATLVQQADPLSEWLMNLQTSVFTRFSSYVSTRGRCEDWGCGMNHNETMVSDATMVQQADTLSEWLMNLQTSVFTRFSSYVSTRGRCEEWGCGSNHNETLVRDVAR